MPYVINSTQGDLITISDYDSNIQGSGLYNDFTINLLGRNYPNYGELIAKNFLDILNTWAGTAPPDQNYQTPKVKIQGQLWYDTINKVIRVWETSTGSWRMASSIIVTNNAAPSNDFNQNVVGAMYYNKNLRKLYVHDGVQYRSSATAGEVSSSFSTVTELGNPQFYGAKIRTIHLIDTDGVPRSVMMVVQVNSSQEATGRPHGESIIAMFSDHDEFVAADVASSSEEDMLNYYAQLTETGGIGTTIRKGMNLRTDNFTRVHQADVADYANVAYNLNIGSYGNDNATNITAGEVYWQGENIVSHADDTYDIGAADTSFANAYITNIALKTSLVKNGDGPVTIGTEAEPIDAIYGNSIVVTGTFTMPAGEDIGDENERIGNVWAEYINTSNLSVDGYNFPSSHNSSNGQQLFITADGDMFFDEPITTVRTVTASDGLTITFDEQVDRGLNDSVSTWAANVSINNGKGIIFENNEVVVNMNAFNTDDLPEGTQQLYFTQDRARASVSHNDAGGDGSFEYDETTGVFTYTGPSSTEVRNHFGSSNSITANNDGTFDLDNKTDGGIAIDTDGVYVDTAWLFGAFSEGTNIEIATDGTISYTGTTEFDDWTPGDFVQMTGAQTVKGNKTFYNQTTFNSGVAFDSNGSTVALGGDLKFQNGTTDKFIVYTSGDIWAAGDVTSASDRRIKDNLEVIPEPLAKIAELTGYTYIRTDTGKKQTGLIAQDVEKVLPEAVENSHYNQDQTDYLKGVNYGSLMGLMVEAVKELTTKIDTLNEELAARDTRVEELEGKLLELETLVRTQHNL